jgi:hypothetical protein
VPAAFTSEPVTVLRSENGAGMACAPALSPKRFADPLLQQGDEGAAVLSALDAFKKPGSIGSVMPKLRSALGVDDGAVFELIDHLVSKRFLTRG